MSRGGRAFYHLMTLRALFDARPNEVSPEAAREALDGFLREAYRRRTGETVTCVEMQPAPPDGWQLVLDGRGLGILCTDGQWQPAERVTLLDRDYMDSAEAPRQGKGVPLELGRPIPAIMMGSPATIVQPGTEEEKLAERDFQLYGVSYQVQNLTSHSAPRSRSTCGAWPWVTGLRPWTVDGGWY